MRSLVTPLCLIGVASLCHFSRRKKKEKEKQVYLSINNGSEYHFTHKYHCHTSNDLFACSDSQEIL